MGAQWYAVLVHLALIVIVRTGYLHDVCHSTALILSFCANGTATAAVDAADAAEDVADLE